MQDVLAELEALEAKAHRADPRADTILGDVKRRALGLAATSDAPRRIALLADAVRLAEAGPPARQDKLLAEAIPWQREIVAWVDANMPDDAWLRWLARSNLVEVLEQARLVRLGMPPPGKEEEDAIRSAAEAARLLPGPYPRLLSLHRLAATLWERRSVESLAAVLDALEELEPHAWRQALARVHVAFARGRIEDARRSLGATRRARPPAELADYLTRLEASLAEGKAPAYEDLVWEHPPFVSAESPRYELAILLWRALAGGERRARFVAERLRELDPSAEWTRWQAEKLGVEAGRTHEALLAEVLAPRARRVRHARWGEGEVIRETEGKVEVAFAAGRKVLLASVLEPVE